MNTGSLPVILRAIAVDERIVMALKAGPLATSALGRAVGLDTGHAGLQRLLKRLHSLVDCGKIQRTGRHHRRSESVWMLPGATFNAAEDREKWRFEKRQAAKWRTGKATPQVSWWVVPPQEFKTAAQRRAEMKGWLD